MSSSFRRYEILLPRQFNDGQPVPDELIADTVLDLRKQFGAVSAETQTMIAGTASRDSPARPERDKNEPSTMSLWRQSRGFFVGSTER